MLQQKRWLKEASITEDWLRATTKAPAPYGTPPPSYHDTLRDTPPVYSEPNAVARQYSTDLVDPPAYTTLIVGTQTRGYLDISLVTEPKLDVNSMEGVREHAGTKKKKQAAKAAAKSKWADDSDDEDKKDDEDGGGGSNGGSNNGDGGAGGDDNGDGDDKKKKKGGKNKGDPDEDDKKKDEEKKKKEDEAAFNSGWNDGDTNPDDDWGFQSANKKKKNKKGKVSCDRLLE